MSRIESTTQMLSLGYLRAARAAKGVGDAQQTSEPRPAGTAQPLSARQDSGNAPPAQVAAQPSRSGLPTMTEIMEHRGETVDESNARYDVNGDGQIDNRDLIYARVHGAPVEDPEPPTMAEIMEHRGETVDESNARYDVNGDGQIDNRDLIYARVHRQWIA